MIDQRFETIERRFIDLEKRWEVRLNDLEENWDARYNNLQHNMDLRFADMNQRMDQLEGTLEMELGIIRSCHYRNFGNPR